MRLHNYLKSLKQSNILFFFLGISSFIWFLVRVIPKPSRASYPCMQATAPLMSAFVIYIISLTSTFLFQFRNNKQIIQSRFMLWFAVISIAFFSFTSSTNNTLELVNPSYYIPNQPIGVAKGIFPGRVVWVHNPEATLTSFKNIGKDYRGDDLWYLDKNCNQDVVAGMLNLSILEIAGTKSNTEAWDEIFKYFNNTHGKGDVGYASNEKIAIKLNLTGSYNGPDPSVRMDATPQLVLALLQQLVEIAKVPQKNIWIGDNYRTFRNEYWNKCHAVYPDVHYFDGTGFDGREKTVPSVNQVFKCSDKLTSSSLPQHIIDAAYLINVPCLKSHDGGGITLAAKNHQGSIIDVSKTHEKPLADFMHYSLPFQDDTKNHHKYRHLVDFMGHKDLGGKTLLYILDGIWAGVNAAGWIEKWNMAPFNGDYPSSIFVSQDAVAIESVGFDFLLAEYINKDASVKYPYINGVDDYLLQAADPANWPAGIQYDPEGDGTILSSLGVYEHWNNATSKKYSRNLGTGNGIELRIADTTTVINSTQLIPEIDYQLFPNPFSESITLNLKSKTYAVNVNIYNLSGKLVFHKTVFNSFVWNGSNDNGAKVSEGIYIISAFDSKTGKLLLNEKIYYKCN